MLRLRLTKLSGKNGRTTYSSSTLGENLCPKRSLSRKTTEQRRWNSTLKPPAILGIVLCEWSFEVPGTPAPWLDRKLGGREVLNGSVENP